jgi:alginate O-acetyltransferase complex protein AlgI
MVFREHVGLHFLPLWLPVVSIGLSFYIIRAIGYLIDVYKDASKTESQFTTFALYISFFGHLPAGPITPWKVFKQQVEARQLTRPDQWYNGIFLFSKGLLKKTSANFIGWWINPVIDVIPSISTADSWMVLFGYSVQIYLDFSGYTDMARGVGKLVGIDLPENFIRPYSKRNLIDFWNTWHITLSHWLRDYLFVPLGRALFKWPVLRRVPLGIASICYLITFTICGVWHGLTPTFLVWGVYHGIGLSGCKIYGNVARRRFSETYFHVMFNTLFGRLIATGGTFLFVSIGWVFFRSETMAQALDWLSVLLGSNGVKTFETHMDLAWVLLGSVILTWVLNRLDGPIEQLKIWQQVALFLTLVILILYYIGTLFYSSMSGDLSSSPFIYR